MCLWSSAVVTGVVVVASEPRLWRVLGLLLRREPYLLPDCLASKPPSIGPYDPSRDGGLRGGGGPRGDDGRGGLVWGT